MKKYFFTLMFLLLIFCKKERLTEFDYLLKHNELKEDLFEIPNFNKFSFTLIKDTILVGKEGTKFIIEKDLFENYLGGKIEFEYAEFYEKEEIIKHGLTTTTVNNELLQTSGMFFINFTEDENQLKLKKGKFLKIQTAKEVKLNSQIFNVNNAQNFEWTLSDKNEIYTNITDVIKNYKYGITPSEDGTGGYFKEVKIKEAEQVIKKDLKELEEIKSINNSDALLIDETFNKEYKDFKNTFEITNAVYDFYVSKFGWINIDEILKSVADKEVSLIIKDSKIDYLSIFVIYLDFNSNYNSIIYDLKEKNNFTFKQVGTGKILFVHKKDDKILFDKFYFGNENLKSYSLNLKEVSLKQLKNEIISK